MQRYLWEQRDTDQEAPLHQSRRHRGASLYVSPPCQANDLPPSLQRQGLPRQVCMHNSYSHSPCHFHCSLLDLWAHDLVDHLEVQRVFFNKFKGKKIQAVSGRNLLDCRALPGCMIGSQAASPHEKAHQSLPPDICLHRGRVNAQRTT